MLCILGISFVLRGERDGIVRGCLFTFGVVLGLFELFKRVASVLFREGRGCLYFACSFRGLFFPVATGV